MKCSAHRQDGNPCQAKAIRGATVCRVHGGSAPQVKAKAMERLLAAVDPIMGELVAMARSEGLTPVKMAAVKDALDRAGIGEAKKLDITLSDAVLEEEIARLKAELGED